MANFDHCVLKAVCALAYFGFLRSTKFTVFTSASFSPALHLLEVGDIAVDSTNHPSSFRVRIQNKSVPQGMFCSHRLRQATFVCCGCCTCVSDKKRQYSRSPVLSAVWGAFNSISPLKIAATHIDWHFPQSQFSDRGSHCRFSEGYSWPCDSHARVMDKQCLPGVHWYSL